MKKKVSIAVMCIGIIMFAAGLFIKVPGNQLTTYSILDGKDGYSSIEEYVGGDAYNYIIGASLVAGKISGTIAMKSVFISVGTLIFCIGLIMFAFINKDNLSFKKKEEEMKVEDGIILEVEDVEDNSNSI